MWGQVTCSISRQAGHRIIPTRVGTSFLRVFFTFYCYGSSPRVWGQVSNQITEFETKGIIPTRVGTRGTDKQMSNWDKDHPHACGDKRNLKCFGGKGKGSSPRVWGQARNNQLCILQGRIIPTRVGTSEYFTGLNLGH